MRLHLDCIPCFVRQTLDASRFLDLDDDTSEELMHRILRLLTEADWELPPPVIGRDVHRVIREMMDNPDPYKQAKTKDNESALRLFPRVEQAVAESDDPFEAATKFAIAGNAIDLGAKTGMDADVDKTFEEALKKPLEQIPLRRLEQAINKANRVLYLLDNAGEIVFDRPLLAHIGKEKLTVAVRGHAVINDATLPDVEQAGIAERYTVITNGSDTPGTYLPDCSPEFAEAFNAADLIISKGQGNFETLSRENGPITFLLLTKCPTISNKLNKPIGTYVIE